MRSTSIAKAMSTTAVTILIATAMVVLTLYSVYTLSTSILTLVQTARTLQRSTAVTAIPIEDLQVYVNGTIVFNITNCGDATLRNVYDLDVVVVYVDPSTSVKRAYRLTPYVNWWIESVCIKGSGICFNPSSHQYLKPGEIAAIRGFTPFQPDLGGWGYVAVITPSGYRTEKAFAIVG